MFRPHVKPKKKKERFIKGKARTERKEQEMKNRQAGIPECRKLITFIPHARITQMPGDTMRNPYGPIRKGKAPTSKYRNGR